MRIPSDALISREKLVDYLLEPRPVDDKSGYLSLAGFSAAHFEELESAIRDLTARVDATEDASSAYGIFWKVKGVLMGPGGKALPVVLIWMQDHQEKRFRFITLRPPGRKDEP